LPTALASGPLTTSAMRITASSSTMVIVTRICSGRNFQKGRPSCTSYTEFEARMKAPM
jgi:hypothetical protein